MNKSKSKKNRKIIRRILCTAAGVMAAVIFYSAYWFHVIPHRKYSNEDIGICPKAYEIEEADRNIDFRRVKNLRVYLERNGVPLTTDLTEIDQWQGGDIVVWQKHIGIVSDIRNRKGIPFIIHNANPVQLQYEEDILETWGKMVGHYRMSQ